MSTASRTDKVVPGSETSVTCSPTQNDITAITVPPAFPFRLAPPMFTSSPLSSATSSSDRKACRICQSETGIMVRPCGCAGTMGDIHEGCLSKWVALSNKSQCEICHEHYAKSGWRFLPIRQWTKPDLGLEDVLTVLILIGLFYCGFYMITLFKERHFFERISTHKLPCRSDDVGRILISTVIVCTVVGSISAIIRQIRVYLNKQKEIRFVNRKCPIRG